MCCLRLTPLEVKGLSVCSVMSLGPPCCCLISRLSAASSVLSPKVPRIVQIINSQNPRTPKQATIKPRFTNIRPYSPSSKLVIANFSEGQSRGPGVSQSVRMGCVYYHKRPRQIVCWEEPLQQ